MCTRCFAVSLRCCVSILCLCVYVLPTCWLSPLLSHMCQLLAAGLTLLCGAVLFVYKRHRAARLADSKYGTATDGKALPSFTTSDGSKLTTTTATSGGKLGSVLSTIHEGTQLGSSTAPPSADWR